MELQFEWDAGKAERNRAKHGVTFEKAKSVFSDPLSMTVPDPDHSESEARWIDIGHSSTGKLLVVWYSGTEERIRIIGCRAATRAERERHRNV